MARKKKNEMLKGSEISKSKMKGYVYVKSQERDSLQLKRGSLEDKLRKNNFERVKGKTEKAKVKKIYDKIKIEYDLCVNLIKKFNNDTGLSTKEEVSYVMDCLSTYKEMLENNQITDRVTRNINEIKSLLKGYADLLENI